MQYYLGQYIWNTDEPGRPHWIAPNSNEVKGVIDLRPLSAQGIAGGTPQGYCFLEFNTLIDNPELTHLGDENTFLTNKQKTDLSNLLGIIIDSDKPVDLVYEVLTVKNDKSKVCPPLMPDDSLKMNIHLGGRLAKSVDLVPEVSSEWPVVLKQLQDDYVAVKDADNGEEIHRKLLTVYKEKYGIQDTDKFIPDGVVKETPLPHETTYTESFNKANSGTLGPDLTWTETTGTSWGVVSNQGSMNATNALNFARAEHDVSSNDNYTQASIEALGSNVQFLWVGCRGSSSAETFYACAIGFRVGIGRKYMIEKFVSGTETRLSAAENDGGAGLPQIWKISANGSTLKNYEAGVELESLTDTSITTGTRSFIVGYTNDGSAIALDSFEFGDLAAGTNVNASCNRLISSVNTGFIDKIDKPVSVVVGSLSVISPTVTTGVSVNKSVSVITGSLSVISPSVNISDTNSALPIVGSLSVISPSIQITDSVTVSPVIGVLSVQSVTATSSSATNVNVSVITGNLSVNTVSTTVSSSKTVSPVVGSVSVNTHSKEVRKSPNANTSTSRVNGVGISGGKDLSPIQIIATLVPLSSFGSSDRNVSVSSLTGILSVNSPSLTGTSTTTNRRLIITSKHNQPKNNSRVDIGILY